MSGWLSAERVNVCTICGDRRVAPNQLGQTPPAVFQPWVEASQPTAAKPAPGRFLAGEDGGLHSPTDSNRFVGVGGFVKFLPVKNSCNISRVTPTRATPSATRLSKPSTTRLSKPLSRRHLSTGPLELEVNGVRLLTPGPRQGKGEFNAVQQGIPMRLLSPRRSTLQEIGFQTS